MARVVRLTESSVKVVLDELSSETVVVYYHLAADGKASALIQVNVLPEDKNHALDYMVTGVAYAMDQLSNAIDREEI